MAALDPENMTGIMTVIGQTLATDLSHADFLDFGMMTSHIYRSKLIAIVNRLVEANQMQASSLAYIIYFAVLVKNKKRILEGLAKQSKKYGANQWFKDTVMFYTTEVVHYVSEAEKNGKFPVVNLPSCMPNIACHFLKLHLKGNGVALSDADLYKKFSENLFFVQMNVTAGIVAKQMQWESNFWNTKVVTSKNPDKARYLQNKGFNQSYFETKAADQYKWIVNGKEVDGVYDENMIIAWLKAD